MRAVHQFTLFLLLAVLAACWVVALSLRRPQSEDVEAKPPAVAGEVRDSAGPVAGARVHFKGASSAVWTDAQGRFHLPYRPKESTRVTAAKEGYFIAGTRTDALPLKLLLTPLATEDHEDYRWVDPVPTPGQRHNCGHCHGDIYREWAASSHARSATNRRFLNLYDGSDWSGRPNVGWNLLADNPPGAGVCNACHAPTASFDEDLRQLRDVTSRGVHCDYCHKIVEAAPDNGGLTHGRYGLKLLRPAQGQLFFGPLDDVDRNEDSFSPLYCDSRYCASCHEGVVFGVHVYSTYSEWLDSPARREGKHCQTCHMAPTGKLTNLAPGKGGIARDPSTLASHRFPGGQADLLKRCLSVAIDIQPAPGVVRAEVSVRAAAGHRVPTGFVDRNLLLLVDAFDHVGQAVPLATGPALPRVAGKLAGAPGKLYAKQLQDVHGQGPAPFWRAEGEQTDTRLEPERVDRSAFSFPDRVERVRLRLLYRRFWQEIADRKGWPDNETSLVDQTFPIASGKTIHWATPGANFP
jgi:hypothetical protein